MRRQLPIPVKLLPSSSTAACWKMYRIKNFCLPDAARIKGQRSGRWEGTRWLESCTGNRAAAKACLLVAKRFKTLDCDANDFCLHNTFVPSLDIWAPGTQRQIWHTRKRGDSNNRGKVPKKKNHAHWSRERRMFGKHHKGCVLYKRFRIAFLAHCRHISTTKNCLPQKGSVKHFMKLKMDLFAHLIYFEGVDVSWMWYCWCIKNPCTFDTHSQEQEIITSRFQICGGSRALLWWVGLQNHTE